MKRKSGSVCKVLVFLVIVLGALAAVRWHAVRRTSGADNARAAIETAISKIEADRKLVSARTELISRSANKGGKATSDEIAMLLGDADLNRIALSYLGADWSIPCSTFLGSVREIRKLQRMRAEERIKRAAELKEDMAKMERQLKIAEMHIDGPADKQKRNLQMDEIMVRINELRCSLDYLELIANNDLESKNADAKLAAEKMIGDLADEYRKASVGRLSSVLTEDLEKQQKALKTYGLLSSVSAMLNFWPLNVLVRQP